MNRSTRSVIERARDAVLRLTRVMGQLRPSDQDPLLDAQIHKDEALATLPYPTQPNKEAL